jgi:kynurenine formamidase
MRGLPAHWICDFLSRARVSRNLHCGDGNFHIAASRTWSPNTGTYLTVPSHRFAEGKDLSQLPLGFARAWRASSPCERIRTSHHARPVADVDQRIELSLRQTGWTRHGERTPILKAILF